MGIEKHQRTYRMDEDSVARLDWLHMVMQTENRSHALRRCIYLVWDQAHDAETVKYLAPKYPEFNCMFRVMHAPPPQRALEFGQQKESA